MIKLKSFLRTDALAAVVRDLAWAFDCLWPGSLQLKSQCPVFGLTTWGGHLMLFSMIRMAEDLALAFAHTGTMWRKEKKKATDDWRRNDGLREKTVPAGL